MTEIREPNFGIDLPGEWEPAQSDEPGTFLYRDSHGLEQLLVTLLAVRPMYAIADQRRLITDYMSHRAKYEAGQTPYLEQTEPMTWDQDALLLGSWDAVNLDNGSRKRHRVLLEGGMLADFAYEAADIEEAAFNARADALLETIAISPEQG